MRNLRELNSTKNARIMTNFLGRFNIFVTLSLSLSLSLSQVLTWPIRTLSKARSIAYIIIMVAQARAII